MTDKFLDHLYDPENPVDKTEIYDAWAATYERELTEQGYAAPDRVSAALGRHVTDRAQPLLDFGCGTGLSGRALASAGFTILDGIDPSEPMLEIARAKKIYRSLHRMEAGDPAPISPGTYTTIAAIGVIGIGAAPPETFDILMRALPKGGLLGLSLNDHSLAAKVYEGAFCRWLDPGAARLLAKENGPHLPGKHINSNIYIIEKI